MILSLGALGASSIVHATTNVVPITQVDGFVAVGKNAEILVDPAAEYTVSQAIRSTDYEPCGTEVPNLGNSRAAHWIRFAIKNGTYQKGIVLSISHAEIDELDVYLLEEGATRLLGRTGQSRSRQERVGNDPEFAFSVPVEPGSTATILIRVHGFKQIHLPMYVSGQSAQTQARSTRNFWLGGYTGIMIVMALYNLFIFASIRDRSYLIYVMYIAVICLAQLAVLGIGQSYLWPDNVWLASRSSIVLVLGAMTLGMEFARRFIGTSQVVPRLHRLVPIFYLAVFANVVLYFAGDPWTGYIMAQALGGWSAIYLLIMVITAMRKNSRQAGYFLLAWGFFLFGVVVFVMRDAGILPYTSLTTYAMPIGSAVEGVLLSFALADRINIMRKEKELSQAEALSAAQENARITRDQNILLEMKVSERTEQLQHSLDQLKRAQSKLVEAERQAPLGQLTAGIAHEINNPLYGIRSCLNHVLGVEKGSVDQQFVKLAIKETDRIADLIRNMKTFYLPHEGKAQEVDIHQTLREVFMLNRKYLEENMVKLSFNPKDTHTIECVPDQIKQVFINIITNAVEAMPEGGELMVQTSESDDRESVSIVFSDTGVGISRDDLPQIFDMFYSKKPMVKGVGLGLSVSYGIVTHHGGTLEVASEEGKGTTVTVTLPVKTIFARQMHLDLN